MIRIDRTKTKQKIEHRRSMYKCNICREGTHLRLCLSNLSMHLELKKNKLLAFTSRKCALCKCNSTNSQDHTCAFVHARMHTCTHTQV